MNNCYVSYNNIISNIGFDSETVVNNIASDISGLHLVNDESILPFPFYSSMISSDEIDSEFIKISESNHFTKLEKMMILSLNKVIETSNIKLSEKVGLIISTTKGNIDLLDSNSIFPKERVYLSKLGKVIQQFFGFKHDAIVVSNACVSGILAVSVAKKFINEGIYDHIFIASGDTVSPFIMSGFNSFQALSELPCRPYDKDRSGINIGEVAASVLVTNSEDYLAKETVTILGDASANDANHISGPSRTGEGLYRSVFSAMKEAKITSEKIDFISAHGTATFFNDEMEAVAFQRLNLGNVPINSLKGYFGHTLGASGLLETIVGMHSLNQNILFASKGFNELGVSQPLNVIKKTHKKNTTIFLKTASGFGGCNTAVIFQKKYN